MSIVFIKFDNRHDEAVGVDELSRLTRVSGYRGGVWGVAAEHLERLDELKLAYRAATGEEVDAALGSSTSSSRHCALMTVARFHPSCTCRPTSN